MTALKKFERLESLGLWKETETSQKVETVVSFGKSSLVISDHKDTPLTHWALGAIEIVTSDEGCTIYAPDKEHTETLEITDQTMNRAIEKVRKEIRRPRSHRGRIRLLSAGAIVTSLGLLSIFWLPKALADYTTSAITDAKSREIGAKLMPYINQYAGTPCRKGETLTSVRKLEDRLIGGEHSTLFISDLGARKSMHLPGGIILANKTLVENYDGAEILAGYVLMEKALQHESPALHTLFLEAGPIATISFLVTGEIKGDVLEQFAKDRITGAMSQPDSVALLELFKSTNLPSIPFAKTLNASDATQALIDGNPVTGPYEPLLTDPQWLALQTICEN
ncbi:hypothetical protein F9L33_09850 [Amylibacter sp. SFDW26]|uniref:hypothetical protein n=1 Tax=Amylibacter sp. SFDW26 TaxID=2652722 RepID=UPI0012626D71|nr:hypothetical protein [Amylibacter sp. SFDW26]KAB7613670.1 hypothetical protein F9L33_09850 [Amylibacter sp. SFDW26]